MRAGKYMSGSTTPRNTQQFVDYRLGETDKKIEKVEQSVNRRLDSIDEKMGKFTFITQDDLAEYKAFAIEKFASKDEMRPVLLFFKIFISVLGVVLAALAVAVVNFILKGGLKP